MSFVVDVISDLSRACEGHTYERTHPDGTILSLGALKPATCGRFKTGRGFGEEWTNCLVFWRLFGPTRCAGLAGFRLRSEVFGNRLCALFIGPGRS